MAMTKAEKAEMNALRVRAALNWPEDSPKAVDLDVARAGSGVDWLHLWWFNTGGMYGAGSVGLGCTNGHNHSRSNYTDEQIANRYLGTSRCSMSQEAGGPWYATKLDALKALRSAETLMAAERLASVDERIAEESK